MKCVINKRDTNILSRLIDKVRRYGQNCPLVVSDGKAYKGVPYEIVSERSHCCFDPLYVEVIGVTNIAGFEFSVLKMAHYFKSKGRLVPDPVMELGFMPHSDGGYIIIPMSFQTCFYPKRSVFDLSISGLTYSKSILRDHKDFLAVWLRNLKVQQNLGKISKMEVLEYLPSKSSE